LEKSFRSVKTAKPNKTPSHNPPSSP